MTEQPAPEQTEHSEHHFHEADKNAGRWAAFWWTVSLLAHVGAVFSLIYFTPLRKWFFAPPKKDIQLEVSGHKLSRMVEAMVNVQTKRLRDRVLDQREILLELESARDNRYERYAHDIAYLVQQGREGAPAVENLAAIGLEDRPDIDQSLDDKSVGQLYDFAQEVERVTYHTYRQVRATELARIQSLSLKTAFEAGQLALPEHPELNFEIVYTKVTDPSDPKLQEIKEELLAAIREVSSMVAAAQRMLDLTNELIADDIGWTAGGATPGSGVTAAVGSGKGEDATRDRENIFDGYSPPDPEAFQHQWGRGVGPVIQKHLLFPQQAGADLGRVPPTKGRKLMDTGAAKGDWMHLDTWYIIGPFPNPNRENLDKKFPPETTIDLDATYVGAGGRLLRWEYRQSFTTCIYPHVPDNYSIWYAFTEVYSDKEREKWCIFGSDDYGKAWLDEDLIYASGKTPHPWIPDRAYKKVAFKKGYNPILFKLENAWGRTGFSMCIYMGEM